MGVEMQELIALRDIIRAHISAAQKDPDRNLYTEGLIHAFDWVNIRLSAIIASKEKPAEEFDRHG